LCRALIPAFKRINTLKITRTTRESKYHTTRCYYHVNGATHHGIWVVPRSPSRLSQGQTLEVTSTICKCNDDQGNTTTSTEYLTCCIIVLLSASKLS
jgi:hypothetical protein